jgi:hypothetical protein
MAVEQRTKRLVGTTILVVEVEYYLAADLSRALETPARMSLGQWGPCTKGSDRRCWRV